MSLKLSFRFHALQRMFERGISEDEIKLVLDSGKVIEDYPTDQPYPSCLKLGFVGSRPIHVVLAYVYEENTVIIITVYEPDLDRWEQGFESRRKS